MYPAVPMLLRKVSKAYHVPETKTTLEIGSLVMIPVYSIHFDEEYYPDPERFEPERFSPEECAKRHQMAFLPFGEGPRYCVGMRFGVTQSKLTMAMLIKNYKFSTCSKTVSPTKFLKTGMVLKMAHGLYVNVQKIKS